MNNGLLAKTLTVITIQQQTNLVQGIWDMANLNYKNNNNNALIQIFWL